jgi:hypothetical protein
MGARHVITEPEEASANISPLRTEAFLLQSRMVRLLRESQSRAMSKTKKTESLKSPPIGGVR